MDKVIIYCRKSAKPKNNAEKQEERKILSLESQENGLKEYARKRGFKVVKIFSENESAYRPGRPMFNEMVDLFEQGKADHLLVWHLTRIARNSLDGGKITYFLDEKVLQSIITPEKSYQNTGEDKFILAIEFAMAKKSSDDTSSFVKRDIQTKANNGEFPGKAPLGYLNIDKEGKIAGRQFDAEKQLILEKRGKPLKRIEIDPISGKLLESIFTDTAKSIYTLKQLCSIAHDLGLRATRSSKKLSISSLERTLTNSFYHGAFLWEGELYTRKIKHEALISKKLFDKVQEVLRRKSFTKKEQILYTFSNTMICGECGGNITSQMQKGHKYYHCNSNRLRAKERRCLHNQYYREEFISQKVIELLKAIVLPDEFIQWAGPQLREKYSESVKEYQDKRIRLQRFFNVEKRKLANLIGLKISPENENGQLLQEDEYLIQKKEIRAMIDDLESKLNDTNQNERNWINDCEQWFDFTKQLIEKFEEADKDGDIEKKRTILKCIGSIRLNRGELAFIPQEPYSFAFEVVEIKNSFIGVAEPPQSLMIIDDLALYKPVFDIWRDVLERIRTFFMYNSVYIPEL